MTRPWRLAWIAGLPIFLLLSRSGRGFPLQNPSPQALVVSRDGAAEAGIEADYPELVDVPGGTFSMGGHVPGSSSSLPEHAVRLDRFAMSRYEVTFAQYDRFCVETGRPLPPDQGYGRDDRPAGCVNWYDALEYCNWLSEKRGRAPCYGIDKANPDPDNTNVYDDQRWTIRWNREADGYRLPTEAEWEYAARGGNRSGGFTYSGGNRIDEVAWYSGNSGRYPHSVGAKRPNELGLCDMSGNAYEWTWDWYSEGYSWCSDTERGPSGILSGGFRVLRGGSCFFDQYGALVFHRKSAPPYCRLPYVGFRIVAREAEQ